MYFNDIFTKGIRFCGVNTVIHKNFVGLSRFLRFNVQKLVVTILAKQFLMLKWRKLYSG